MRHVAISRIVARPGITPFQGYDVLIAAHTQGYTLGCGITRLRRYEDLTVETDQ